MKYIFFEKPQGPFNLKGAVIPLQTSPFKGQGLTARPLAQYRCLRIFKEQRHSKAAVIICPICVLTSYDVSQHSIALSFEP